MQTGMYLHLVHCMLAVALELKQWLVCFRNPQMFSSMHLSRHPFLPSHYFLRLFQLTIIANYYVRSIVRDVWPTVTLVRHFNSSSPFPYRMHCFDISVVLHQPARPTVPVLCFSMYTLCGLRLCYAQSHSDKSCNCSDHVLHMHLFRLTPQCHAFV